MSKTKLTTEQQEEIRSKYLQRLRAMHRTREYTVRNLAAAYGVGYMTVWRLVELIAWDHRENGG